MEQQVFKTPCQIERDKRDKAIYDEYNELMAVQGQSATIVTERLMNKYGIHSQATIYIIRKRVANRLRKEELNERVREN